jgi:hypothetical protein
MFCWTLAAGVVGTAASGYAAAGATVAATGVKAAAVKAGAAVVATTTGAGPPIHYSPSYDA